MQPPPVSSSPAPPASAPSPGQPGAPPEESEWRVGTLTYTRGGLVRLFSWLLWGDFAWSVRDRSIGPVLQLLLSRFKASDTVAGLLVGTFPAVIGLILGPIISYRSDRLRTRMGRRLPFLIVSAPVAALSIVGLGYSPLLGGALHDLLGSRSPGLYPSILIVLGLWWIAFDFATTITNSVFGALINDTVPHGVIGRFYGMFRAVSLIVGIAFNYYLLKQAEVHYQWMFFAVGVIYGVGVVWMCLMVREGEYPPPPPSLPGSPLVRFFEAVRGYFREGFTKPFYLWFFAAATLGGAATSPVNLYNVFFAKSLHMDTALLGKYLAWTYVTSLCLALPLGWLCDRFHPVRMSMVAIGLYGVATVWSGLFAVTQGTFGVALLAHGVLSGTYYTCSASLGQRLLPKEKFAQISSAGGLIGSLIGIGLPIFLGRLLDVFHHDYRLTFYVGSAMAFVALGCLAVVHRYWLRFGGPHDYVAPV